MSEYAYYDLKDEIDSELPFTLANMPDEAPRNYYPDIIYYADAANVIDSFDHEFGDQVDCYLNDEAQYTASEWLQARQEYAQALAMAVYDSEAYSAWADLNTHIEMFVDSVQCALDDLGLSGDMDTDRILIRYQDKDSLFCELEETACYEAVNHGLDFHGQIGEDCGFSRMLPDGLVLEYAIESEALKIAS
jgi:hypothetical protein